MIRDAGERLNLDPRRLYAAGFSGGARVASGLALGGAGISGVILCGAGFPPLRAPLKELPFTVFAVAGLEDFNYREIRTLERDLTAIHASHKTAAFPGGHDWAPPGVLAEALDWLDLQAVRGRLLDRNETWLDDLYARRLQASQSLVALARLEELASLQADFDGLLDTASTTTQIAALETSKEVKVARRDEALWADRETDWLNRVAPLSAEQDRTAYRDEINALRRKASKLPDTQERRLARRLLTGEFIRHVESGRQFLTDKRHPEAAARFSLAAEVRPDDAGAAYAQARALALAGDHKGALKALSQAVARGFRDAARLAQDPAMESLHAIPAFDELLGKVRRK